MFSNISLQQLIFGRLTLEAIPYHEPILLVDLHRVGARRRRARSAR